VLHGLQVGDPTPQAWLGCREVLRVLVPLLLQRLCLLRQQC
jgi:hypothetical protein